MAKFSKKQQIFGLGNCITYGLGKGQTDDGPLEVADADHVKSLEAHRVPDANVRLEKEILANYIRVENVNGEN